MFATRESFALKNIWAIHALYLPRGNNARDLLEMIADSESKYLRAVYASNGTIDFLRSSSYPSCGK